MKLTLTNISSCVIILICYGCSKVIYTQLYDAEKKPNYDSKVYLIQKRDSMPVRYHKIADVDIREDWSLEYTFLKPKIEKVVREKGGNLFKIKECYVGKNTKGAAIRILGSVCSASEDEINEQLKFNELTRLKKNSTVFLVYVYKEDGGIASLSSPKVYANKELVGELKNKSFITYQGEFSGEVIFSTGQLMDKSIKLLVSPGKVYYLRLMKNAGGFASGNSGNVQIGGNNFKHYEGEEGRFNFDSFLNRVK